MENNAWRMAQTFFELVRKGRAKEKLASSLLSLRIVSAFSCRIRDHAINSWSMEVYLVLGSPK